VKKKKKSSLEDIILDRLHDQFFNLRLSCFMESSFFKIISKLSHVYLPLGKLVNEKYFSIKEKFGLVSRNFFIF
jgi:hypothetical protein